MSDDQTKDQGPDQEATAAAPKLDIVPEATGRTNATALQLLLDVCERFGVNPDQNVVPQELLAWRFYGPDTRKRIPASVVIVTGGGVKLRGWADPDYPLDEDTEANVRRILHLFRTNPKTKEVEPLPIPADVTLPDLAVTGATIPDDQKPKGPARRQRQ